MQSHILTSPFHKSQNMTNILVSITRVCFNQHKCTTITLEIHNWLPYQFPSSFLLLFCSFTIMHEYIVEQRVKELCVQVENYVCSLEHQHFVILWCKLHVMYEVESSLLIMLFEILRILSSIIFLCLSWLSAS